MNYCLCSEESCHWLFVSSYHSMFGLGCVKLFQRVFLYTVLICFHSINLLHSVMFLCFCKVPHNFQSIDSKLWFFRNSKLEIGNHLNAQISHLLMDKTKSSFKRAFLKTNKQQGFWDVPNWMWIQIAKQWTLQKWTRRWKQILVHMESG